MYFFLNWGEKRGLLIYDETVQIKSEIQFFFYCWKSNGLEKLAVGNPMAENGPRRPLGGRAQCACARARYVCTMSATRRCLRVKSK